MLTSVVSNNVGQYIEDVLFAKYTVTSFVITSHSVIYHSQGEITRRRSEVVFLVFYMGVQRVGFGSLVCLPRTQYLAPD